MVQNPQTRASERNIQSRRSTGEDVAQDDQGAMGLLERAGDAIADRIGEIYSAQNMERAFAKMDRDLPGFGTLLKEIFNAISGAMSGDAPAANMSDDISAAVYGTADPKSDGARMQANFAQREGFGADNSIGSGTGGAILELNGIQMRPGGKSEDDQEDIEEFADGVERAAAERDRIWDEQKHSFADIELTGEEWEELGQQLSGNTPMRRKMIERLMREGKSQSEAEQTVDKAGQAATIMGIPEADRTDDQKKVLRDAGQDPDVRKVVKWGAEAQSASVSRGARASENTTTAASTQDGSDIFASAPNLTEHHQRAVAATEPLDRKPDRIAAVASSPTPNMGGLDV